MVDWIQISQNSGSGDATITVTASSYSQLLERSTSLTVRTANRSAIVGITQRYNSAFEVSPTSVNNVPESGGTYRVTVIAEGDWYVSVDSQDRSWVNCTHGSGSGNSYFDVTISANTGSSRTTMIRVGNSSIYEIPTEWRYVQFSQVGSGQSVENFNLSPYSLSFGVSGGTAPIAVSSNDSWTLTAPVWVTLSAYSGTGNATITATVPQNDGSQRYGYISGGTANVTDYMGVTQYGNS